MMDSYGGYRIERSLAQDGQARAHGVVLSVLAVPSGEEVFGVAAWVTDHLGRRTMTGQGVTELAVMFAEQRVRSLIDDRTFESGSMYREVHGFDPLKACEVIARDRIPLAADPEPPLPGL
jgi:hypothetical protein